MVVNGLKRFVICAWRAGHDTVDHDGVEHAGYLAFLSLLSLFPFLVLLVAVAGVLGNHQAGQEFVTLLLQSLPPHVARVLEPRVQEIVSGPPQSVLTIAILGAIWTSSSAVEGLRTTLNRAYRVSTPPSYTLRRLLSILQLLLVTLIVVMAMVGLVFVPIVYHYLQHLLGISFALSFKAAGALVTYLALFVVLASIYYFLPNIQQRWRATFPGAAIAAFLWMVMATVFSLYLSQFQQVNLIYGSLAGFIATLLFFYLMSMIAIFGAEFNYRLEKALGHAIVEREVVG